MTLAAEARILAGMLWRNVKGFIELAQAFMAQGYPRPVQYPPYSAAFYHDVNQEQAHDGGMALNEQESLWMSMDAATNWHPGPKPSERPGLVPLPPSEYIGVYRPPQSGPRRLPLPYWYALADGGMGASWEYCDA